MRTNISNLRKIIKEETAATLGESSLEDLEARLSAMDTRRAGDNKKVKHRATRNDLNEVARTLQLMFDVTTAIIQKGTEVFRNRSVYGIPVREQPALKELADIVREYAKHVKAAEGPINEIYNEATDNLKIANETIERMLSEINELPNERVDTTTRGGPSDAMAVDAFLDGRRSSVMGDPPREELKSQVKWLGRTIETVARNNLVPDAISDRLADEVKNGFLAGAYGILGETSTERAGSSTYSGHLGTQPFRLEKGEQHPEVNIRNEIERLVGPYIKDLLASGVPAYVTMGAVDEAISDLILGRGTIREEDENWIQGAEKDIEKRGTEGVCTGDKFGGPTCKPGTKRYNLAKTFRKMAKEKKK